MEIRSLQEQSTNRIQTVDLKKAFDTILTYVPEEKNRAIVAAHEKILQTAKAPALQNGIDTIMQNVRSDDLANWYKHDNVILDSQHKSSSELALFEYLQERYSKAHLEEMTIEERYAYIEKARSLLRSCLASQAAAEQLLQKQMVSEDEKETVETWQRNRTHFVRAIVANECVEKTAFAFPDRDNNATFALKLQDYIDKSKNKPFNSLSPEEKILLQRISAFIDTEFAWVKKYGAGQRALHSQDVSDTAYPLIDSVEEWFQQTDLQKALHPSDAANNSTKLAEIMKRLKDIPHAEQSPTRRKLAAEAKAEIHKQLATAAADIHDMFERLRNTDMNSNGELAPYINKIIDRLATSSDLTTEQRAEVDRMLRRMVTITKDINEHHKKMIETAGQEDAPAQALYDFFNIVPIEQVEIDWDNPLAIIVKIYSEEDFARVTNKTHMDGAEAFMSICHSSFTQKSFPVVIIGPEAISSIEIQTHELAHAINRLRSDNRIYDDYLKFNNNQTEEVIITEIPPPATDKIPDEQSLAEKRFKQIMKEYCLPQAKDEIIAYLIGDRFEPREIYLQLQGPGYDYLTQARHNYGLEDTRFDQLFKKYQNKYLNMLHNRLFLVQRILKDNIDIPYDDLVTMLAILPIEKWAHLKLTT